VNPLKFSSTLEADSFDDIAHWGRVKEARLSRFLTTKNGIPAHNTVDRVFSAADPARIEATFHHEAKFHVGSLATSFFSRANSAFLGFIWPCPRNAYSASPSKGRPHLNRTSYAD
jgi:hypothetical protein